MAQLASNRTYVLIVLASSFAVCTMVGFNWWSPSLISYMLAADADSAEQIFTTKQIYSIIQTVSGALGTLFPAEAVSRLRSLNPESHLLAAELTASSFALFIYLLLAGSHPIVDMLFYAVFTFFINSWRLLTAAILLDVVDPSLRAIANAILLFTLHLLGDSMAPYWIGAINDLCLQDSFKSFNNQFYCTQLSLYPLVVIAIIGAAFSLFSTLTIQKDRI